MSSSNKVHELKNHIEDVSFLYDLIPDDMRSIYGQAKERKAKIESGLSNLEKFISTRRKKQYINLNMADGDQFKGFFVSIRSHATRMKKGCISDLSGASKRMYDEIKQIALNLNHDKTTTDMYEIASGALRKSSRGDVIKNTFCMTVKSPSGSTVSIIYFKSGLYIFN